MCVCVGRGALWFPSQGTPRAFEFNELFLITIHDCLCSSQFGTFLCNAEKQRVDAKLHEKTESVWSYLYSRRENFRSPLYDIGEPAHQGTLPPFPPRRRRPHLPVQCTYAGRCVGPVPGGHANSPATPVALSTCHLPLVTCRAGRPAKQPTCSRSLARSTSRSGARCILDSTRRSSRAKAT